MTSTLTSLASLPLEQLTLYHAVDSILSSVFVFCGPVVTANSTISSSRIQAHIITPVGLQSYSRITISPVAPLYAAVNHLPREKQGDEVYRGLAVCLFKCFGDMSESVRNGLVMLAQGAKQPAQTPGTFDDSHAAELANSMVKVENPDQVIRDLKDGFAERVVPWIDMDLVLPPGTIVTPENTRESITNTENGEFRRQYGNYSSLVEGLGEPIFLPTSKLRRAPSQPTNSSKSKVFSASQKEALRLAMCEVVDTEERYVGKMYDLVHNIALKFRQKAADKLESSTSPDAIALAQLFPPCLNEILDVNMGFLSEIRDILEQSEKEALFDLSQDTHIDLSSFRKDSTGKRKDSMGVIAFAQSLLDWFPRFSQPYGDYMHAHHAFSKTMSTFLTNQHSSFSKRVYETGEQRMRSILMEPVQRLPRYSLLIDAMTGALPSAHPAVKVLLKARDIITEICSLDSNTSKDNSRVATRLHKLVPGIPFPEMPSGRLITTVDYYEVPPPHRVSAPEARSEPGIMLLYSDYVILLSKTAGSTVTARGLHADLNKSSPPRNSDQSLALDLRFSQAWRINTIRCSQSPCGRILYVTPLEISARNDRLSSSVIYALELASTYEGKAGRFIEDFTKARIESRFPENYRESGKWTLHSLGGTGGTLGILMSVFESGPSQTGIPSDPPLVELIVGGAKTNCSNELGHSNLEVLLSISTPDGEKYKMELQSIVGTTSTDTFIASDFVSILTTRLNNILRPLSQPQNPVLTNIILSSNFNILRAIAGHLLGTMKQTRGFRPPSPTKFLYTIWGSGQNKESPPSPPKALPAVPVVGNIPSFRPPGLERPRTPTFPPTSPSKQMDTTNSTHIGINITEKPRDELEILERIFNTYILAIRSRSGNIVGRVLRSRHQANPVEINDLYNVLLEDADKVQAAAEVSVDVLFVAFETFMAQAWKEKIGPLITAEDLKSIQAKFDTMFPGDFEDYFHRFITEMSPQNRRALTALIKLLAQLLDASGNDGDRGALTATFSELLTEDGDPIVHISLLDRLVEDFDRLFDDTVGLTLPLEGTLIHDPASVRSRSQSVTTGSINSQTSSFRKRFGFGMNRERGKSESEGKVSSIIRTLSKSKPSGDPDSPAPSFSKASLLRSKSTDLDARLAGLLRPVSRERALMHGLFFAEDQGLRPNSAHSNAPTLASIGEDKVPNTITPVKKKRRSSLSDLKPLASPVNLTPMNSPPNSRKPLTPASSSNRNAPPDTPSPTRLPIRTNTVPHLSSPEGTTSQTPKFTPSPSKMAVSPRKENVPPSGRVTEAERSPSKRPTSIVVPQLSPRKRIENRPHTPAPRTPGPKDKSSVISTSDTPSTRPPLTSSPQKGQKLRMQNPQKLRERLQNEKKALASAESSLQAELSSIGAEISGAISSPTKFRPLSTGSPSKSLTSPSVNPPSTLNNRMRQVESKVSSMTSDFSSRVASLEKDVENSLLVSERRARKLDELYRDASAENEALYDRFNTELSRVTKDVRVGAGEEALKSQLKDALEEVARLKKENLRLKREIGGLRAQQAGTLLNELSRS
ncbi:hypothetical protein AJ80_01382 [Polytolypa hystricis UAMH7299]|uniref:DH domain-containing protein n=1 Tax=Polytolypa hystricis (strain UAMH7299) TaxID=1447883 RepID=A0A2B7Z1J5_POLH7|nr:hypothetical protein AJ80_01382 [Polytolypa hystricis UAMH7299]